MENNMVKALIISQMENITKANIIKENNRGMVNILMVMDFTMKGVI